MYVIPRVGVEPTPPPSGVIVIQSPPVFTDQWIIWQGIRAADYIQRCLKAWMR